MPDELTLPWGKERTISFTLPEGWNVKAILKPHHPAEFSADLAAELDRAMRSPTGSAPLSQFARRGKTAGIVIDDRTRPTPVRAILPRVIGELHQAGVNDRDIVILIALGAHRDMTESEIAERVGPEIAQRFRVVNHHYKDKKELVYLGNTPTHGIPVTVNRLVVEADTVVLIGCIEAHEQAGFGGGYKNIMPGVAGHEPIHATHTPKFQMPERMSSAGMPKARCRFRQAVDECGALLGPKVFIVNIVLDPTEKVAIVAGHPLDAHKAGTDIYRRMAEVKLDGPADVVIVGARPLDIDFRVSMKAAFNASPALKPGGLFILVSAVPDGLGDLRLPPKDLPLWSAKVVKKMPMSIIVPLSGRFNKSPDQAAGALSLITLLKTASHWLYLTPVPGGLQVLSAIGMEFFTDISVLLKRASEIMPRAEVVVMPQGGASFMAWE